MHAKDVELVEALLVISRCARANKNHSRCSFAFSALKSGLCGGCLVCKTELKAYSTILFLPENSKGRGEWKKSTTTVFSTSHLWLYGRVCVCKLCASNEKHVARATQHNKAENQATKGAHESKIHYACRTFFLSSCFSFCIITNESHFLLNNLVQCFNNLISFWAMLEKCYSASCNNRLVLRRRWVMIWFNVWRDLRLSIM